MESTGIGRGSRSGGARLFLLAGLAVLACAKLVPRAGESDADPRSVVLARVGPEVVTAGDLGGLPPNADAKARLEVLVRQKLAAAEARRRGLQNDPGVRTQIAEIHRNAVHLEEERLGIALYNSIRLGMLVSEADLRAFYETRKDRYTERQWALRMRSYPNDEEAWAADAALGATGRLDPAQSEALGPLPAGKLPLGVVRILDKLQKPGDRQVVPLDRWTVVEFEAYLPAAQLPFETVRDQVEFSLRAIRGGELVRAEIDRLRVETNVTIDEAALAAHVGAKPESPPAKAAPAP